ncbi:MAG: GNAT family N-acetyltransferase [Anaerolineae bacterium]|nr:GNAT family N-acetyltransferase [Anaerolineae bacterium]
MPVTIREITADQFLLYDAIPNWFGVESVLRVEVIDGGLGGFRLVEESVAEPFIKTYDDDGPTNWVAEFDLGRWGIFLAADGDRPVGGAAVAVDAPVYPLDKFQRRDLAVLWDIRVHPEHRGRGVGSLLFDRAADWARRNGWGQLGLETSSVNVPACRFYARKGCELGAIHRYGYAGVPQIAHEAMLLWYLDL